MLTFEQWLQRYGPEGRAYSVADLQEGWNAALREMIARRWQFRVVRTRICSGMILYPGYSAWHDIPLTCVEPMAALFGREVEFRCFIGAWLDAEPGDELLTRLNRHNDQEIPI